MAMPIGRRSEHGAELGQEDGDQSPTGTAISMAMNEVTSVP